MIETLDDLPVRSGRPAEYRLGLRVARIERFDPRAVISLGNQFTLERRALEDAIDEFPPLFGRRGGKFGGKRHVAHGFSHATTMPGVRPQANLRPGCSGAGAVS